jgi:hypothetical protein
MRPGGPPGHPDLKRKYPMKIKKSLLAVATAGAVTFAGAGAGVATADELPVGSFDTEAEGSQDGQDGNDILSSLTGEDSILGSFADAESPFKTISNITAVIGLITAGIGLGNALDIKLPELPF